MDKKPSRPEDARQKLLRRVGTALQDLIRNAETARELAARSQNLHPTDFACIGLLYRVGEPISPKQIIEQLNLSSGSGTALLDRLEKAGYIKRLPNPDDRRSVLIEMDEEKAAEPLRRYREIEQKYLRVTENLTERDLEMLAQFMEGITALAGSQ